MVCQGPKKKKKIIFFLLLGRLISVSIQGNLQRGVRTSVGTGDSRVPRYLQFLRDFYQGNGT